MKKIIKKSAIISLCFCMTVLLSLRSNALSGEISDWEWNEIMRTGTQPGYYSDWLGRYGDADHAWVYSFDSNRSTVLNQYTSGIPQAGTKVSSWKYISGDKSQQWRHYYTFDGKYFISPVNNKNLFLEIYRVSSTSSELQARCNSYINNYYEDGEATLTNVAGGGHKVMLQGRTTNGAYYPPKYLAMGSVSTPVSDGNGTSKYTVWNAYGTTMYLFDGV